VFFNLFSEAEPFAAILIAHGTHFFFFGGGLVRPEGPKFEAKGPERGRVLGEGAASPLPSPYQLRGLGQRCKLSRRGSGQNPDRKYILDLLRP